MAKREALITGLNGGLELAQWTKCHCADCGKSSDSNHSRIPRLVGQIWVTCLDKNSYPGKLWEKEGTAYRRPAPVVPRAQMPCGYPGLGQIEVVP